MIRKNLFITVTAAAVFVLSSVVASAQFGPLHGHVKMQQADGTMVPAADAAIDVYRTDITGKYNTKTDKKGEFRFAGLPFLGTYVIAASLPNAQPGFLQNVNVKQDTDYEIVLSAGDGKRFSLDEIKKAIAGGGTAAPTAGRAETEDEKKRREDFEKQKAQNARNTGINEIVGRTFKAGNAALLAKNYEEAIKQYQEGLAADPEQAALCTQVAIAFRMRAVELYNAAIQSKDEAAKVSGIVAAKKDFTESAENANRAVELGKKEDVPEDAAARESQVMRKLAALSTRAESMRLFVTKVNATQADAGLVAFHEYIDAETDPARKNRAQMDAAQMLLDAGFGDKAFLEFKKILDQKPDDPDANLGAGLALYSGGDKAKYQEAANYLQHFVDVAPDTHKSKADIKAVLQELKNTENVVPEKATPKGRRRP
jgi:tetratricopeptide (TPR) repeat protein